MSRRTERHSLERYREMRDFARTSEPSGGTDRASNAAEAKRTRATKKIGEKRALAFVVQKHAATRLHYDFRLELDGVLLSWAVPKGPSLVPGEKRLAVEVEPHPFDYRDFEGTIPRGQYGGGEVIVWDRGTWAPEGDPRAALKKGRLDFSLEGDKLRGRFILVRTHATSKKPSWLLMKRRDPHATGAERSIVDERPESVLSGRTVEDVATEVAALAGPRRAKATKKNRAAGRRGGHRVKKLPPFGSIAPQLATLVDDVPRDGGDWIYEIKFDGYRSVAWLERGEVKIASRRGLDWTAKYGPIAQALSRVRAASAVFDGEIAYVLDDGRTDFQKLQNALSTRKDDGRLVYFVFDLLFCDGVDLRSLPLVARKEKLRAILAGEKPPLKLSDHMSDGAAFFSEACALGLEGIIGKRADLAHRAGRTTEWVKIKCQKREEVVIVGFTPPRGGREGIGALLVASRRRGEELRYAGKVGTGFSTATLRELATKLGELAADAPQVADPPRVRGARWVLPKLVAEVRFSEWTAGGALRHPTFEGLREDKPAREVFREVVTRPAPSPTKVSDVKVTHPERVLDATTGATKLDYVRYIEAVAPRFLALASDRPLMLLRCPTGVMPGPPMGLQQAKNAGLGCFVQKHRGQGLPRDIRHAKAGSEEVVFVREEEELVGLAQHGVLELHGWGARLPRWDRPDWMVFDLDPDEALPFDRVVDGAIELRDALKTLDLESWVKTTGGKGLHVVVPLERRYGWHAVKGASETIARLLVAAAPERYVAKMAKKARTGKIFVDYLRNGEGATAVLPYSARARPGLTVALPVAWKDLRAIDPREMTIATVPALLARQRRDPWEDLAKTKQRLPKALLEAARAR